MKRICLPVMICCLAACDTSEQPKDSVGMAKEENQIRDSASVAPGINLADHNFLVETYSATLMEIQLGKHASVNAASPDVKQVGKMLAGEHARADSALTVIARAKGLVIPNEPGSKHQQQINELLKKQGPDFDKDYMKLVIESHESDIKRFEEIATDSQDEDIRSFAAEKLPLLRKHLQKAKQVKEKL